MVFPCVRKMEREGERERERGRKRKTFLSLIAIFGIRVLGFCLIGILYMFAVVRSW